MQRGVLPLSLFVHNWAATPRDISEDLSHPKAKHHYYVVLQIGRCTQQSLWLRQIGGKLCEFHLLSRFNPEYDYICSIACKIQDKCNTIASNPSKIYRIYPPKPCKYPPRHVGFDLGKPTQIDPIRRYTPKWKTAQYTKPEYEFVARPTPSCSLSGPAVFAGIARTRVEGTVHVMVGFTCVSRMWP